MIDERLKEKFESLLKEGEGILRQNGWPSNYRHPDQVDYIRFRTESLNLIRRACGENSDHYREMRRVADGESTSLNSYFYRDCYAILQAASKDYEDGLLFDIRNLVAAELFVDFLDQAKHLLENGFHVPAASLTGAVLEDGLRKLCVSNSIPVPDKTKIGRLNDELARADIYSKLVHKNIIAYADIRNNADHGHPDEFKREDVEAMISWVGRFLAENIK